MKDKLVSISIADANVINNLKTYVEKYEYVKGLLSEDIVCGYGYYHFYGTFCNCDGTCFAKIEVGETLD